VFVSSCQWICSPVILLPLDVPSGSLLELVSWLRVSCAARRPAVSSGLLAITHQMFDEMLLRQYQYFVRAIYLNWFRG
jgi:hypothetical protein